MLFQNLNLNPKIKAALKEAGYVTATPIQERAIAPLLDGKDLLGCAQTGTGKTAAFALPIIESLSHSQAHGRNKKIKSLVLAPTRELAIQIADSFKDYSQFLNVKTLAIFGGVSQNPQTASLSQGIDILVATPGRLLDLISQNFIKLKDVEFFVLDEADMMLDMGMIHDVRKIIKELPQKRQSMFFSATMPKEIEKLSDTILRNPVKVEVTPVSSTVDTIEQSVYFVNKKNKVLLLMDLLRDETVESALVFSRTKHGADKIVKELIKNNLEAQAIHGNKSQNARQLALKNFKERTTRILVATDIAARGIDVDDLSHVFIYDLPEVAETYVHRIGRTGRKGLGGIAISFCDEPEKHLLRDVEKLIEKKVPVVENHKFPLVAEDVSKEDLESQNSRRNFGRNQGNTRGQSFGSPKGKSQNQNNKRKPSFNRKAI